MCYTYVSRRKLHWLCTIFHPILQFNCALLLLSDDRQQLWLRTECCLRWRPALRQLWGLPFGLVLRDQHWLWRTRDMYPGMHTRREAWTSNRSNQCHSLDGFMANCLGF